MKALIFNSGIGKRMMELTAHSPKSMVHLYNDETIFERQIRLLQEAGITEVVITTGPYPEMLEEICRKPCYGNMHFVFPRNEIYDSSNYIYSMYKAREYLDDDILMMHGDLVFDRTLIPSILRNKRKDVCLIDKTKPLPDKDFKGRIVDGVLREVRIDIFDDNCFAFQPLYKLSKATVQAWLANVIKFVERGEINVYAENALNEISRSLSIHPISYHHHFIDEIDNKTDLVRVNKAIETWDFKKQLIFSANEWVPILKETLVKINSVRPLFVVDKFMAKELKNGFPDSIVFSGFTPNPKYEEMLQGLEAFKENRCDSIVSIGGGSCIDVAKAIKMSINADLTCGIPTFKQEYLHTSTRHICLPTTSGTGSESTRHSVLYFRGEKQSICCSPLLPDYVILSGRMILSVPDYQKKATAMDALCQCIESLWSKKATKDSRRYALKGLQLIRENYKGYLQRDNVSIGNVQLAANYSGKAINISETTAAHAMSYKITSMYGIPHGHAVAICMNSILNNCKINTTYRGINLERIFYDVAECFGLSLHIQIDDACIGELTKSVNPIRLDNFPYTIDLEKCYRFIGRIR